jgi:hypothetical protein
VGAGSNIAVTTGSVTLGNVNTYAGSTSVYGGGILVNGVAGAVPTGTALILGSAADNSNGTFDLNGGDQTVTSLDSAGSGVKTVTNNGAALATLTVSNGGTYGGGIADGFGTMALTVGGGHLVLGGVNSYTGATGILSGAELTMDGSLGNTVVNVNSGATLSGTGSIAGTVVANGNITGTLTFGNDVAIGSGVTATAAAFNGNVANDGSITNGFTVQSGKTLSGSGSVTGDVTVTSGTINGTNLTVSGQTVFNGASTLAGSMTSGGGIHVATNGALNVTGHTTSNVSVNSATLHGTGSVGDVVLTSGTLNGSLAAKAISGTGLVSPGESGGILTATSVTSTGATGLLNFAFELTANSTDFTNAASSVNDILHITSSNGLTLDAGTNITIFFDSLSAGAKYDGGFFVDSMSTTDLETAIANATFTFYVKNAVGGTEFNGNNYSLVSSQVSVSAINVDFAPFAGDTVSGAELEFTVVPEPSTWAMMVGGLGALIGFRRLTGRSRLA